MPAVAVTELICFFFEGVVTYALWYQHDRRKSSFFLIHTLLCNMSALLADAIYRILSNGSYPEVLMTILVFLSYFLGNVSFIPFILYCREYIQERMQVGKWVFRIPLIASGFIIFVILLGVSNGALMMGTEYLEMDINELAPEMIILPSLCGTLIMFVLVYLPVVAFRRRKQIGLQPAALTAIFGVFPLVSSFLFRDYIVIAGSMSLVIVAVIMQNTIAFEREKNEKILKEKADELMVLNIDLKNAREMAEAANEAKTVFLNNMSHDIRTPMNAILGFTNLMEKHKDEPEVISDYLDKITQSGEYLLSIINNILEVARIDSGSEELDEDFVDLLKMRGTISHIFEAGMRKKNITFTATMSNIEHQYIFADAPKITEIAMNLVGNALKYTPEGGTITLTIKELPSDRQGYASFEMVVSDNGIGMSQEFLEHIFDSFARERNTTESKVIGTGLGMSIVKKLVELMDGTVEVSSELGKGTSIRVVTYNRIVQNPESYMEKTIDKMDANFDFTGKRILLAEDNELNAEIAMEILEEQGIIVEHAKDGVECVNMVEMSDANQYDLILMDVQMPNLNGYDATKRIRSLKDATKSTIPIIAMTANAFEEDKKNALEAGMNAHVGKPINIGILFETMAHILY